MLRISWSPWWAVFVGELPKLTKMHNDANIIAFGARVVGDELAKMILDEFFGAEFEGGRHENRVKMITEIEEKYSK